MNRIAKLAILQAAICFAATLPANGADSQVKAPIQWSQPVNQEQVDYVTQMDHLLDRHDFNGLSSKMLRPPNPSMVAPTLDWAKTRIMSGGSVIIALLDANLLWAVGTSNPSAKILTETSSMMALYAFLVTSADGVKCEDETAPQRHFETIFKKYTAQFGVIAQLPNDRKKQLIDTAILMEAKTAPLRGNDNYLCRFGFKEMQASIEKHGDGKELHNQPGYVGKTFAVEYDPNYMPKFLPREQWVKKQSDVRAQFPTMTSTLIERFKNAPPKTP